MKNDINTFKRKKDLIRTVKGGTVHTPNNTNMFGLDIGTVILIENNSFVITEKFKYEEIKKKTKKKTGYNWEEYSITSVNDPLITWFLEVEMDDKLYISLTKEKFNASKLEKVNNKIVSYNGTRYYLDEKSTAICTKFSNNESWTVTMEDFESDDDAMLSIETWEDSDTEEAYFYTEVAYCVKFLKS